MDILLPSEATLRPAGRSSARNTIITSAAADTTAQGGGVPSLGGPAHSAGGTQSAAARQRVEQEVQTISTANNRIATVEDTTAQGGGVPSLGGPAYSAGDTLSAAEQRQANREQRQQADFQRYVYMRERNGVRLTKYESNPSVRQAYNISSSCARPFPPELTQRQSDVLPPTAQSRGQTDAAATFVLLSAAALAANAASPLPFAPQAGQHLFWMEGARLRL